MKNLLLVIALLLSFSACQQQNDNNQTNEKEIDNSLPSLYPIGNQWIELQNLQTVNNPNQTRNFKTSNQIAAPLQTKVYSQWCDAGNCFQFNAFNDLEMIPQEDLISEITPNNNLNFFFPVKNGWITATSLENENIYTIKLLNIDLEEQWTTIYKKSEINEEGSWINFAQVLEYNDHLLVFNSSSEEHKRSAYIDLYTGNKVQKDEQWKNILIDTDQKNVLGRLIEHEDFSYSLEVGSNNTPLQINALDYPKNEILLSDNNIFVIFYRLGNKTAQLLCLDYHTATIKWKQTIENNTPMKNIIPSYFMDLLMIEIEPNTSTQSYQLYIFQQNDGGLLGEF